MATNELKSRSKTARRIETLEKGIENLEHVMRIAKAMEPDPREWAYNGAMAEGGENTACACGHKPIKTVFVIERARDGASLLIGSVCIESTVPHLIASGAEELANRLKAAVEAHREALAKAEREKRDAAASLEVQALLEERMAIADYSVLRSKAREAARRECRYGEADALINPSSLLNMRGEARAATTPGRTAAALRTQLVTAYVDGLVVFKMNGFPHPRDSKVRARVLKAIEEKAEHFDRMAAMHLQERGYAKSNPEQAASEQHSAKMLRLIGASLRAG